MNVGLEHYLTVSAMLFSLGLLGVILRRNVLVIYMSLELMLNAANLALGAFPSANFNLLTAVIILAPSCSGESRPPSPRAGGRRRFQRGGGTGPW